MDPISLTAAGVGLGIAGIASIVGELMAQGKREEAQQYLQQAEASMEATQIPELQRAVAEQIGSTAFEQIKTDPALRRAQMGALSKLGQIAEEGGMTLEDKAALNQITGQLSRQQAGARQAIMENMAARGTLGSGAELAQRLSAQQESAQQASQRGLDVAAMAQRRAFDAIMQRGQLGGSIRAQEYGEASNRAQAQDAIARYNADARQRSQAYNLDLPMKEYDMRRQRDRERAALKERRAGAALGEAQETRQAAAGYGTAAGRGAGLLVKGLSEDEKDKKDGAY